MKGAGGDLTELVFLRLATRFSTRALAFGHPGTFFTGYSANAYLQVKLLLVKMTYINRIGLVFQDAFYERTDLAWKLALDNNNVIYYDIS